MKQDELLETDVTPINLSEKQSNWIVGLILQFSKYPVEGTKRLQKGSIFSQGQREKIKGERKMEKKNEKGQPTVLQTYTTNPLYYMAELVDQP